MFTKILKISFFLILFFISSCGIKKSWEESGQYTTSESATATYVWKKGKQYIAIVHTIPVRGRNTKNTIHPINISTDTISKSFSKLEYNVTDKKGKKSDSKPVFSKGNIELLSKKIPEALKLANKNQDILFEVFQLRKKFWILPTTVDSTAGYLFIEPGKINVIFEKINEDYQGYDYDEPRSVMGNSSQGIYGGYNKVAKGWVVLTSKSWN
jgi:hypothetical protein|tara:strand:- start:273 stop:905 length:633 start_codon:yes stop_codon:yes gene_type:complete